MKSNLISIIIPTFNRSDLIVKTLDSIIAQTYKNWECIVVDDGSTDNTQKLIEEYITKDSRFQYHHRPKDRLRGGNAARNYGFEVSRGEYIQWFDSDDLMHPEKLKIQIEHLIKSELNFCVCQNLVFENSVDDGLNLRHQYIHSLNPLNDFIKLDIVWMTPSAIWRKKFLQSFIYLFDEELLAAQEWEFHCRILAKDSNYIPILEQLVYLRKHPDSISYSRNNEGSRLWYYFLARFKIYTNSEIELNDGIKHYLRDYMLTVFRNLINQGSRNFAFKIYIMFIIKDKNFSNMIKTNSFLALVSSLIFNKSYYFLNKIKVIN